jgi:hypothetical protein
MHRIPAAGAAIAAVFALAGAAWPVQAAPTEQTFYVHTTRDLVELCSASAGTAMGTLAIHFCQGYMVGVFQALRAVDDARGARAFCPPNPPPTRNQAIAAFVQWSGRRTDMLDVPPVDSVFEFLTENFPCRTKS